MPFQPTSAACSKPVNALTLKYFFPGALICTIRMWIQGGQWHASYRKLWWELTYVYIFVGWDLVVWLSLPKSQQSWVRSHHPSTEYIESEGRQMGCWITYIKRKRKKYIFVVFLSEVHRPEPFSVGLYKERCFFSLSCSMAQREDKIRKTDLFQCPAYLICCLSTKYLSAGLMAVQCAVCAITGRSPGLRPQRP